MPTGVEKPAKTNLTDAWSIWRRSVAPVALRNMVGKGGRIVAHPRQKRRIHPGQPLKAKEVKTWHSFGAEAHRVRLGPADRSSRDRVRSPNDGVDGLSAEIELEERPGKAIRVEKLLSRGRVLGTIEAMRFDMIIDQFEKSGVIVVAGSHVARKIGCDRDDTAARRCDMAWKNYALGRKRRKSSVWPQ